MIFWVDAQLPPSLAPWLTERFGVQTQSMRFLGLQSAEDADNCSEVNRHVEYFESHFVAVWNTHV